MNGDSQNGDGTNRAPGWYPDPTNGKQDRWWDGTQWTDQVQDLLPRTHVRAKAAMVAVTKAVVIAATTIVLAGASFIVLMLVLIASSGGLKLGNK